MKTKSELKRLTATAGIFTVILISLSVTGCTWDDDAETMSGVNMTFEAMFYDNNGNNYVTFTGNEFNITPHKIKQYGYDSDGSYISYYETSSIVTVDIDGHTVDSCGSTIIFKESSIDIIPIEDDIDLTDFDNETDASSVATDGLKSAQWYFDMPQLTDCKKIVLIQSQDGYNIGAVTGDNITWEVAETLPKTTLITVDGKSLYIHRCNFTIIDTALFDTVPR